MRRYSRHCIRLICVLFVGIGITSCGISKSLNNVPDISAYSLEKPERIKVSDSSYAVTNGFLNKNKQGSWELYVKGNPMQLGLATGALTQELFHKQENALLSKVDELVPSKTKQYLLRKFLAWFNRKMYLNINEDFKAEIYGLSYYASPKYQHIAEPYPRILYLHGAHDIGHALQDLALVGCSSFAAWGDKTEDGKLIIGRNLDFYAGDTFAEDKIIAFIEPEKGHPFMSVTWGGMLGVVSGMNNQGLTVTINAGKSKFPLVAKTPISLVTREILQYASTIEEAIAIAKSKEVFVSESIFVGSAKDKEVVLIEVSPKNFGVYKVENQNTLVCSNHFQSVAYVDDEKNQKHILESHSQYRYERMQELLQENPKVTPEVAVGILRNKEGLDDKEIGYGNEKALNQLLAHHGIVFKPEELLVWVSSNPYQLGEFVAYDLNTIFKEKAEKINPRQLADDTLTIAKDSFQFTKTFANYESYRVLKSTIEKTIRQEKKVDLQLFKELQKKNPNHWEGYYISGKYLYEQGYYRAALAEFNVAKTKEITTLVDQENIDLYIRKIKRKIDV
ncbi:C45 family peptidase [uncultured Maribacter sp.]|uniref:C45 family autoproteolytic acyltransferase/hydolase n=1 Tax=uncultured Maribacter sp. TaxID=431308 RepID=UPI00261B0F6F|nr:C45 family peptidase [uncultured Maribacter sp.]